MPSAARRATDRRATAGEGVVVYCRLLTRTTRMTTKKVMTTVTVMKTRKTDTEG